MAVVALLMLQVASTMGPALPGDAAGGSLLVHPVPSRSCGAQANEIVVCGKDADGYRVPSGTSTEPVGGLPKAQWKIFGDTQMGVGTSQRNVGGFPSNAVMLNLKIPF